MITNPRSVCTTERSPSLHTNMSTSSTPRLPASIPVTLQQPALTGENVGSSPQWTSPGRSRSRCKSAPMDPQEEWARLFHAAERRKIQNRNAQRKYRQSLKKRLENLESQGAHIAARSTSSSSSSSSSSASASSSSSSSSASRPSEHFESRGRSISSDSIMTLSLPEICEQDGLEVPTESIKSKDEMCPDGPPTLHHRWSMSCVQPSGPFGMSDDGFGASLPHFDPTMFDMQQQTDFTDLSHSTTLTSDFEQYTQSAMGLGITDAIEPHQSQSVCQADFLQPPQSFSAQNTPNLPQRATSSPRSLSPLLQPTGANPMHLAAMRGFVPILEMLLEQGADVNEADERGCTALHLAVEQGQEEAVRVLLKHGADLSAKVH